MSPDHGDLAHLSRQGSGIDAIGASADTPPPACPRLQSVRQIVPSPLPNLGKPDLNVEFVLGLMLLGTFTGFLAGLLGIGGGMLMVPFLTLLFTHEAFGPELIVHMAVATSLTTILFTSASSVRAHHRHGAVRWDIAPWMGAGAVVGTFLGAQFASALKSGYLAMVFALFVGSSATRMLFASAAGPSAGTAGLRPLARPVLSAAGAAIGFVSSLVGAGGGFLTVPFLTWRGLNMRNAVATSAAMGFPIAAGGLVGYVVAGLNASGLPRYSLGFVYLPALFACAATSVLMAPVGAGVAHRIDVRHLRRIFALLLLGLAAYMLWKGLRILGRAG